MGLLRFTKARLSRRLFALFVLSAFLPLALLAAVSLWQVNGLLSQQAEARLTAMAKNYGMTLFERLLLACDVSVAVAGQAPNAHNDDSLARRTFEWVAAVRDGDVRKVMGEPHIPPFTEALRSQLLTGKPAVFVPDESHPRVLVVAPLEANGGIAIGEVRQDYLWGPPEELPAATEFCIVEDGAMRVLFCSAPMSDQAFAAADAASRQSVGAASWRLEGEEYHTRAWSQFLRASFGTRDWIVVATQAQRHQLARAAEFSAIYVPVVLLALLLVTWLSLRQSRDVVQTVQTLASRSRDIARNQFGDRLDLRRDDEFGELATAIDTMSGQLGRQIASLTALSEIDRLILATQDVAQIVRTVLHRMGDIVDARLLSITLFDRDNPENARTYFAPLEARDSMSMLRHEGVGRQRESLEREPGASVVRLEGASPLCYLQHLDNSGLAVAYVQPIVSRGTAYGALVLAYEKGEPQEEERRQARELADRLAVAVSSAWRDEELYVSSHFDPLTSLPNRLLFEDRLERELARSQREGIRFGLLFIDLDHFKNVNDSYGHGAGDMILREAARRISRCLRETDTVARLGGDEFAVLVTRLNHPQEALVIGESIIAALSAEFSVGEQQRCFLSASIGIASYPGDGASAPVLLKCADTAMYRAKAGGRAQVVFFEEQMNAEAVARLTLDRDLRAAMDRSELMLHFQAQLDLRTGAVRGAEALLRWTHPVHGPIPPLRFIALAEESGFIEPLGRWVLQAACAQAREWRDAGLPVERIAVNVSPRQFRKRSLVDFVAQSTAQAGISPAALEIEVTEGLLVERSEAVESMLHKLAEMGHHIALDDFGTGFSSMAYLKRFPVHTIKIDRVFVDGIEDKGEAIVAAIVAMSHALGKEVIAEGVETPEQLAVLRRLGCDMVQGYLLARPMPASQFVEFVRARRAAVPTPA
jgi:diguanylate cyclase (GGDEF)-like protein